MPTPISFLAASILLAAALLTPPRRVDPCYTTIVAMVTDTPYALRRIVTSGVRRFDDAGGGTRTHCIPTDADAPATLHHLVARRLGATDSAAAKWFVASGLDARIPRAIIPHLLAAAPRHAASFEFVELSALDAPGSPDLDTTRIIADDSAHARCLARNAALERQSERFRYLC
jgi:hypothetical protein